MPSEIFGFKNGKTHRYQRISEHIRYNKLTNSLKRIPFKILFTIRSSYVYSSRQFRISLDNGLLAPAYILILYNNTRFHRAEGLKDIYINANNSFCVIRGLSGNKFFILKKKPQAK